MGSIVTCGNTRLTLFVCRAALEQRLDAHIAVTAAGIVNLIAIGDGLSQWPGSYPRPIHQLCLVDKGATTVFFNHRSLQEFLVANAIADMSLAPGFQTRPFSIAYVSSMRIGNFLIGGAGESKIIEGAILNWFPAFRDMYHSQLSVVAIRTVVAFLSVWSDLRTKLSELNEPWFDLCFFPCAITM